MPPRPSSPLTLYLPMYFSPATLGGSGVAVTGGGGGGGGGAGGGVEPLPPPGVPSGGETAATVVSAVDRSRSSGPHPGEPTRVDSYPVPPQRSPLSYGVLGALQR